METELVWRAVVQAIKDYDYGHDQHRERLTSHDAIMIATEAVHILRLSGGAMRIRLIIEGVRGCAKDCPPEWGPDDGCECQGVVESIQEATLKEALGHIHVLKPCSKYFGLDYEEPDPTGARNFWHIFSLDVEPLGVEIEPTIITIVASPSDEMRQACVAICQALDTAIDLSLKDRGVD